MTLLIILGVVFLAVFLMVVLGEKFGSPMSAQQQGKFSKIVMVLVFILILSAIIKNLM